jgi:transcriptional regulator with XRE-family HTH domain
MPRKAYIEIMPQRAYCAGMKYLLLQTPAQLADQLRSLRKSRGLTQAALGALVGLDQTRIAKIEREPWLVSVGQLLQLLAALRVRVLLEPLQEKGGAVDHEASEW